MKLGKFRKGQMAVIMTLAIATLLGVMALGTDVGVMYYNWGQLQKGADAAALAGANYLNGGVTFASTSVNANCAGRRDDAQKAACTYAINNGLAYDGNSLKMFENVPVGPIPNLQVIVNRSNLPFMFGRVIGLSTYKVAAVATAKSTQPANSVQGLFPMGMQCNSPCSLNTLLPGSPVPFGVKFTPAPGGAPGNWQWLDNGQGAKGLGSAISNGMSGTFTVDPGTVTTKPGNNGNAGPVISAFSSRMASCPSISDPCGNKGNPSNIPSNDPCLVTVPVLDFAGVTGKKAIPIEAFALVYLEPSSTSTSITACYVKAVSGNAVDGSPSALNLGAIEPPKLIQ